MTTYEYFQDPKDRKKSIHYGIWGENKSVKYDKAPLRQRSL